MHSVGRGLRAGPEIHHRLSRRRRIRRGRGVSDVVATILLLALTVTLFASIFAFVTTFPSPPAQNNNQFQANLLYTSNLTYVTGVRILHLAGPSVAGNGQVYLKSATHPSAPEFQNPYTVSSGLGGATNWNLGQVWNLTFLTTQRPQLPDNITIYVVAGSQLLFSVILPGTAFPPPPTVVSTSISPTTPSKGQPFTVFATVAGNYGSNSVYVNLAAVPTLPATAQKMTQNAQGVWTYSVPAGATTASGTYYGFVNASNAFGQKTSAAVVITISAFSYIVANITLNPTTGVHTSAVTVTITGTGFAANGRVSITYNGAIIALTTCTTGTLSGGTTITTSGSGTFVCTHTIASGGNTGVFAFTALGANGQTASAYFTRT